MHSVGAMFSTSAFSDAPYIDVNKRAFIVAIIGMCILFINAT